MPKSFLFFFVHPAKFHLFKNTINRLKTEGCVVDVVIISKDVLEDLIIDEGWDFKNIFVRGRKISFLPTQIVAFFAAIFTVIKLIKFILSKPRYDKYITDDILVVPSFLFKIPSYIFVDNDYDALSLGKYLLPFATTIIAPNSTNLKRFNYKKLSFKGNKAIAHLTPSYFTPNKKVIFPLYNDYFILRLSELNAVHDDDSNRGILDMHVDKLIKLLLKHGQVLISSERKLPIRLEKYRLNIKPKDIGHYMSFSKIVVTDSGTMATEAAVLGVPNVLLNNLAEKCGVHLDLRDNFGLQYFYNNFDDVFERVNILLEEKELLTNWKKRKEFFLKQIDDFPNFLYEELIT